MGKLLHVLTAALVVTFLSGGAFAQTAATGNIEGVVTDSSGAVLPGVTVVVRNTETNVSREATTDEGGRFRATALQPGVYAVTATLGGFEAAPLGLIQVMVGQTHPVDVRMRPAGVTEAVTVMGESPLIDTQRTDVSNVVGEKAIENLPINGRRWENFVLLGPAVTNDGNFGLVSYRGISGLYNNNTVDGADNNQAFFSEARGRTRTSYTISQAAIREFQVGVSNFSAEFGRAAGGTVNAVTKSGTNQLRGEAFYFRRDDEFMAKEFFAPFKPEELRQQFGLSVGGPLRPDKVFYFVNYDQQLRDFPYFVRPATGDAFYQQSCTVPGCAATIGFFQGLSGQGPREGNNRILLGKVDVALAARHNLTVQYNFHRWDSPSGQETRQVITNATSAIGKDIVKTDFGLLTLNSVLSRNWLNEVRIQVGRDFEAQLPNGEGPYTSVTGGIGFGMQEFFPRPKYPDEKRYQFIDNVTWYAGAHNLKAGMDINYVREDAINLFQGGGIYNYTAGAVTALGNLASDCPRGASGCVPLLTGTASDLRHYSSYLQAFDLRGQGLRGDVFFTTTDYNFFIQDNWRPSQQLTINFGLRYEYQQLPQPGETEVKGITFTGNPAYPATTRFHQDTNNWGPRAGFTYDVGGAHQTVLRGGYGVYFGRTSNSVIFSALTNNAVTFATYRFTPTTPGAPQYPNVLSGPPTIAGTRPAIQYLSPGLERPEIYMGDLTIDRAVGTDMTISASYLYSKGRHLPTFPDTNLNPPNSEVTYFVGGENRGTFPFFRGLRPDQNIEAAIETRDSVESQYHGLVLQANRRFSGGLLFNANYTLSKAEDTGQNSTTFISNFSTMLNPFDPDADRGTSSFDRRHRFVASFHYAPEFLRGLQIGGVGTFESGLPLTATVSGSISQTATGATNPTTINGSGASNRSPFDERNGFRQEGRKTIDLRLSKTFDVGGRKRIVALWEGFNILNWVNYTSYNTIKYRVANSTYDPATNRATVTLTEEPTFLTPNLASSTVFGPRDMQIGFKFLW
jgi:hypothetical protein